MPVYTAELYPTDIRNAGVGAGNFAGGLALIIVPYLSALVIYWLICYAFWAQRKETIPSTCVVEK